MHYREMNENCAPVDSQGKECSTRTDVADWTATLLGVVADTEHGSPVFTHERLSGYSGTRVIGLLQRLACLIETQPELCYAEIGVFQGPTLLSVAGAAPRLTCFGIDNFSQFDPLSTNKKVVLERRNALSATNAELLAFDYEEALIQFSELGHGKKIGVLFIDGPHDYRSQLLSVLLAMPHLAERAVIVVDDCNYEHIRLSTYDLLRLNPDLHLIFEAYTPRHPTFTDASETKAARSGWWNGIHVLTRDSASGFGHEVPAFGKARDRRLNDHLLHSHGVADHMLELSDFAYEFAFHPTVTGFRKGLHLLRRIRADLRSGGLCESAILIRIRCRVRAAMIALRDLVQVRQLCSSQWTFVLASHAVDGVTLYRA